MEPTSEQIAAERVRLLKVLAIAKPKLKPGSRNRMWKAQRERAQADLKRLERGDWRPETDDDLW